MIQRFVSSLLLLLISVLAHAEENPRHFVGAWQTEETLPVFSGTDARIDVHLVDANAAELQLKGDLFQLASGIAIPVKREISGESGLLENAVIRPWSFVLPIPEVRTKTDFLFSVYAGSDSGETHSVGRISIAAYPTDLLREIRAFSERQPLWLIGNDDLSHLAKFLTEKSIAWERAGSVDKAGDGWLFAVADESAPDIFQPRSGQVLVLVEPEETAGFWTSLHLPNSGAILTVPPDSFENLKDRPDNQLKLMNLFERVQRLLSNSR